MELHFFLYFLHNIHVSDVTRHFHWRTEPSPGRSVGIATDYGLDGPGIESRWGWNFPPVQTGPGAHPASCTIGTGPFPGVNCGRSVLLTTHPLLAPRSWKSRAIPLPLLGHNRACNGVTLPLLNHQKHIVKTFNQRASVGLLHKCKY